MAKIKIPIHSSLATLQNLICTKTQSNYRSNGKTCNSVPCCDCVFNQFRHKRAFKNWLRRLK